MPRTTGVRTGFCVDRTFPPGYAVETARRLDATAVDELWLIEDCFFTSGVSLAAAALAVTGRIGVGIGILPAVSRNPAVIAMEFATLAGLGPGRLTGGIGHGVQDWMGQMGARVPSPLTALDEVITAVRALLRGGTVDVDGRYVRLDGVRLDQPPDPVPPVVAGVQGPRSLELAGRCADGVVLVELSGPHAVRQALAQARRDGEARAGFSVTALAYVHVDGDRRAAREAVAAQVAQRVLEHTPSIRALPFGADLVALVERDGPAGVVGMPDDWWRELAPVGTPDDVAAFLDAMGAAGADAVALFPAADLTVAVEQRERIARLFS